MGYRQSNAAFAYDMQPAAAPAYGYREAPQAPERPRLHVVTGAGREADQAVSPAFLGVIKAFCVLMALFCIVGVARVALSTATASVLNANAELSESLDEGRDKSRDLEVMNSVYSSTTRIRDLASGTLGMVDPDRTVTIDLSDGTTADAPAASGQDAASAE